MRTRMKIAKKVSGLALCVMAGAAMLTAAETSSAMSAELVVYGADDCRIAEKFHRDLATTYKDTRAGKVFQLRQVTIGSGAPGVILKAPITDSPTFVLVDDGLELVRFVGYPGRENFLKIMDAATDALLETSKGL